MGELMPVDPAPWAAPSGKLVALSSGHPSHRAGFVEEDSLWTWEEGQVWRKKTRGEGRERETDGRDSPTPGHATIWSSASWMAYFNDAGQWHWTHWAVFLGSRATNCSSTTLSMTSSTSLSPAISHLRQASPSCCAITKGRPHSPRSSDLKRWQCCSGHRLTRWRMTCLRTS